MHGTGLEVDFNFEKANEQFDEALRLAAEKKKASKGIPLFRASYCNLKALCSL